jgi:predicted nucleic acid-binding protein
MIVADTNLIAYLLIPGDHSSLVEKIFLKDSEWVSPLLWRSEMRNILALYMRTQKMTLEQALKTMEKAENLLQAHEYMLPSDVVFAALNSSALSAYDAEFVVLARELNIPLVTFDKGILKIAKDVAVSGRAFC